MRAYCLDWEMDDEQASDLKMLVRKMDHVFLEWQEKQSKKSKKVGK